MIDMNHPGFPQFLMTLSRAILMLGLLVIAGCSGSSSPDEGASQSADQSQSVVIGDSMSVSADAPQSAEDSSSPDTDDNISDPTTGLTDQTDTEDDSATPDMVASIPSYTTTGIGPLKAIDIVIQTTTRMLV